MLWGIPGEGSALDCRRILFCRDKQCVSRAASGCPSNGLVCHPSCLLSGEVFTAPSTISFSPLPHQFCPAQTPGRTQLPQGYSTGSDHSSFWQSPAKSGPILVSDSRWAAEGAWVNRDLFLIFISVNFNGKVYDTFLSNLWYLNFHIANCKMKLYISNRQQYLKMWVWFIHRNIIKIY